MKRRHWMPVILIVPVLILWRLVALNESLAGGDLVNHFIPIKSQVVEQVRSGQFPHWNPLIFSGRPLQGDIQTGVFYPPNLLFLILPPNRAFDVLTLLHYMLLGTGAFLFFRKFASDAAALLSAIAFAFAGFFVTQLHSGIVLFIFTGAYLPWMLWTVECAVVERKPSGYLWLAACGALQLLAGAPQIAFYSWILVGVFALATVVFEHKAVCVSTRETISASAPFGIAPAGWIALVAVAAAAILSAMLTAVQWMPTREFLSLSFERGRGASWEYVTDGSLQFDWLPTFLAPFLFGHPARETVYWGSSVGFWEFNGFVGIIPFSLAIAGLGALRSPDRQQRRLAWFALVSIILWASFAPGAHSPVFKAAYHVIPGFKSFRVPARWVLAYQLGIAAFAGLGLQGVFIEKRTKSTATFLIVLILLLTASIAAIAAPDSFVLWASRMKQQFQTPPQVLESRAQDLSAAAMLMALFSAGGLLVGILSRRINRTILPISLIILLPAASTTQFAASLINSHSARTFNTTFYPRTPLVEQLAASLDSGQRFVWDDSVFDWTVDQNQEEIYPNRPMMHGLPGVRGYDPVNSLRYGQFMNALAGQPLMQAPRAFMFLPYPVRPQMLALLNTGLILSYQPLPQTFQQIQTFAMERDFLSHRESATLSLLRGEKPLGEAFLARPILLMDDEIAQPETVLAKLAAPHFDWRGSVLVEVDELPILETQPDVKPSVEPLNRRAAGATFRVATPQTTALVLSQSFYPGWHYRIDGGEARQAFPADHVLTGAFVPPGTHEIEFFYLPDPFKQGRLVSILSLALFAILWLGLWLRARR